jgi:hypothetical protein
LTALAGGLAALLAFVEVARGASLGESENLLLRPFAHFLLLFQSSRLFTRRQSRDYLQIYVIGFFELITATALNEDLSYALCFLLYSVSIVWALILFHLRREMEDNYLLRHSDDASSEKVEVDRILNSKRIISGKFLAATGALALAVVLVGVLVSMLIPRFEGGPPSARNRRQQMIGFSDGVSLGTFGRLRENFRVVMRIHPLDALPDGPLYLRGLAFDRYDGNSWSRSDGAWRPISTTRSTFWVAPNTDGPRVQLSLEPLEPSVLFLPEGTGQVRFYGRPPNVVMQDANGNYSVDALLRGGLGYEVSLSSSSAPGFLAGEKTPADIEDRYLQLPQPIDSVAELAHRVTSPGATSDEKARLLENYLRTNYEYTLDLGRDPSRTPLDDFLFVQKRGHCEYFATAMTIMLRTQGIPARVVNGFYGGEWNGYGGYFAIRQGDAHAWVEAYLPGRGWTRFDPTPTAPLQRGGWDGAFGLLYDAWRLWWYDAVVEYDLSTQRSLLDRAGAALAQGALVWGLGLGLLLLGVGGVWGWRRWQRRAGTRALSPVMALGSLYEERHKESPEQRRVLRLYQRALEVMARRGYPRVPSMTAREYAESLSQKGAPGHELLSELTLLYEGIRFGEIASEPALETLQGRLRELERSAAEPSPHPRS